MMYVFIIKNPTLVEIKAEKFVPEGCHLFAVLEHSVGRRIF